MRPDVGPSPPSLASRMAISRLVFLLLIFALFLFLLFRHTTRATMDCWVLIWFGFGFGLLLRHCGDDWRRSWRRSGGLLYTIRNALAAPHSIYFLIPIALAAACSFMPFRSIATSIYFGWSPALARWVVCVVGGCGLSASAIACISSVSYGAHREGLIEKNGDEGEPAVGPHTQNPHIHLLNTSSFPFDIRTSCDPAQLAGGSNDIENKQTDTLSSNIHTTNANGTTAEPHSRLPFRIPRPWDANCPTFRSDDVDDLLEFLENVDLIIELGRVSGEQARKGLLTSYLPVSKRNLWRSLDTYQSPHTYAEFRAEVAKMHPELTERELGSMAELETLCAKSQGIDGGSEGRLRRFNWEFQALVQKLQRAPSLVTNLEACRWYLAVLEPAFALRVRAGVEALLNSRAVSTQLGAGLGRNRQLGHRKEDPLALNELLKVAELVARWKGSWLATMAPQTRIENENPPRKPPDTTAGMQTRASSRDGLDRTIPNRLLVNQRNRIRAPELVSVFARDVGDDGGRPLNSTGDSGYAGGCENGEVGLQQHEMPAIGCAADDDGRTSYAGQARLGRETGGIKRIDAPWPRCKCWDAAWRSDGPTGTGGVDTREEHSPRENALADVWRVLEDVRGELDRVTNDVFVWRADSEATMKARNERERVFDEKLDHVRYETVRLENAHLRSRDESDAARDEVRAVRETALDEFGAVRDELRSLWAQLRAGTLVRSPIPRPGMFGDKDLHLHDSFSEVIRREGTEEPRGKTPNSPNASPVDMPVYTRWSAHRAGVDEFGEQQTTIVRAIGLDIQEMSAGDGSSGVVNGCSAAVRDVQNGLLLNGWREERGIGSNFEGESHLGSQNRGPLLTKKQKRALQRAEAEKDEDASGFPNRSRTGKSRRGKRGAGKRRSTTTAGLDGALVKRTPNGQMGGDPSQLAPPGEEFLEEHAGMDSTRKLERLDLERAALERMDWPDSDDELEVDEQGGSDDGADDIGSQEGVWDRELELDDAGTAPEQELKDVPDGGIEEREPASTGADDVALEMAPELGSDG